MNGAVIEYKSAEKNVHNRNNLNNSHQNIVLDENKKDGIRCTWKGWAVRNHYCFSCTICWLDLKRQGAERITGYLILKGTANNPQFGEHKIDIDLHRPKKLFTTEIYCNVPEVSVTIEYRLIPHYAQQIEKIPYDEMFAASEMNDTVLVIEGKKAHVNKVFLSCHSDYFRALFSSNFREGQMTEIPIKEVTYEDFGLLISTIYPKQVFPTDKTTKKLLELADRFLLPSVTHIVEYHLLNNSNMENEKLLWIADSYGLKNLLEKCIQSMDTVEKVKKLKVSSEYQNLSLETIGKLFCRLLQIC